MSKISVALPAVLIAWNVELPIMSGGILAAGEGMSGTLGDAGGSGSFASSTDGGAGVSPAAGTGFSDGTADSGLGGSGCGTCGAGCCAAGDGGVVAAAFLDVPVMVRNSAVA